MHDARNAIALEVHKEIDYLCISKFLDTLKRYCIGNYRFALYYG